MDKEKELELVEKYPNLFRQYGGNPKETCMAWGITCGNGWYKLIDELCEKLEPFGIVAAQVKEKFGGLRFYLNPVPPEHWDEIYKYIAEAEKKSLETCEECGKPGKRRGKGWIRTLCDQCEESEVKVEK